MNARIRFLRSSTDWKLDRRSNLRTKVLNQISTWFRHELCLGVYTKRRRCPGSDRNAARLSWDFSTPRFSFSPRSSLLPHAPATYTTRLSDWCVFRVSQLNTPPARGSVATVCSTWVTKSCSVRVGPRVGARIQPHQTARLAVRHSVPWRMYSCSRLWTRPGPIGMSG